MHVSSVLNSYFGSKTRDSRMRHTTPFVSWIVLAFVGLREVSELVVWTKAPVETCEVLEERLHEVEAEVVIRVDSFWNSQVRCACCLVQWLCWLG